MRRASLRASSTLHATIEPPSGCAYGWRRSRKQQKQNCNLCMTKGKRSDSLSPSLKPFRLQLQGSARGPKERINAKGGNRILQSAMTPRVRCAASNRGICAAEGRCINFFVRIRVRPQDFMQILQYTSPPWFFLSLYPPRPFLHTRLTITCPTRKQDGTSCVVDG